ncbi:hypothetical protein J4G37_07890 [Microvirga sp. 3-52]|nr:hypothetical protein [Microvirga sp. 3-52]
MKGRTDQRSAGRISWRTVRTVFHAPFDVMAGLDPAIGITGTRPVMT